jgi:preprotein translocase subunit YajC
VQPTALIFIILIFGLMWLLFIRPQRRKQQAQKDLLSNVGPGDEIVTAGGLYGTVRSVEDDTVLLEIAPGLEVKLAKRAVAAVMPPEEELDEDELDEDEEDDEEELDEDVEAPVSEDEAAAGAVTQSDPTAEARR